MRAGTPPSFQDCNCLAIRQAARHVTQFYDQVFAPVGLRATQYAILSRLKRDGLIEVAPSPADRRRRELRLTDAGLAKHAAALESWSVAQQRFEDVFGDERAAALRRLLRAVVAADFAAGSGKGA